jgi:glycosyltransferase involved in cell wall biosynthesis
MAEATAAETGVMALLAGFFEPAWYLRRHPDVAATGMEPLLHYVRHGIDEGRDPNRFFDGAWYRARYPDVGASGTHPLLHYLRSGTAEGRHPHPRFDATWYVEEHPEAAANPLLYHLRTGLGLGYATEKPVYARDYLASGAVPPTVPDWVRADVVVPVYRGLEETRACLESVLADPGRLPGRVIVVDDRSPEPALSAYLDGLAAAGRITLVRNARNLGFVRSVNAGMAAAGRSDVVLLNSDTEVAAGWLARLAAHAHAGARVASVSPLSNNATICGHVSDAGGPVAFGLAAGAVDAAARAVNAGRFVEAPTTVGFCMYIRRDALDAVGEFDAAAFGMGYGEENDFCCRATALGWRHRIACDTYVYHKGSVSFGARAKALARRAMAVLGERYPGYARAVDLHVRRDAIGPFRFALTGELLRRSGLPVILMVSHGLGGGVARHLEALGAALAGRAHVLLLRSSDRGGALSVPALEGHPELELAAERVEDLALVLRHCGVSRVHVHNVLGMDFDIAALVRLLGVPFDVTVHDWYALCPQLRFLPAPSGLYCNEPGPAVCNACIAARPSHGASDILSWRAERAWLLRDAERVLAPCADVVRRLERFGTADRAVLAPHEGFAAGQWPLHAQGPGEGRLRIAVIGVLADHKGARTVAAVAEAMDPKRFEIVVIGHTEADFPVAALGRIKATGPYKETELAGLIERLAPHVAWFPGAWPETFSYTLSAAIEAGLPIAAARIGAFPERLAGRPLTWLADAASSPAAWLSLFERVRAELPQEAVTGTEAERPGMAGFYPDAYLRAGRAKPARRKKPVIAVVPERYETGAATPCAFIRLLQPLDHPDIGGGFEVVLADAESVLDMRADAIVTQRDAPGSVAGAEALAAHARATGAVLLYDLDDDLANPAPGHPEAAALRAKAKVVRRMLGLADAVWVSTPGLAERLAPLRGDATVVANGLDERIWVPGGAAAAPNVPPGFGPLRVLCMGTTTHERDFAMIAPALARLKAEYWQDIEIDVIGTTAAPLPDGVNRLSPPHHAYRSYPGFVDWFARARPGWHVGLAPLAANRFNAAKSSIKALDYAALGLFVLASEGPVYRGSLADGVSGSLVANTAQAWHAALEWLVRNRALRDGMAERARAAFLAAGTLAAQAEARRAQWAAVLARAGAQPRPSSHPAQVAATQASTEPAA